MLIWICCRWQRISRRAEALRTLWGPRDHLPFLIISPPPPMRRSRSCLVFSQPRQGSLCAQRVQNHARAHARTRARAHTHSAAAVSGKPPDGNVGTSRAMPVPDFASFCERESGGERDCVCMCARVGVCVCEYRCVYVCGVRAGLTRWRRREASHGICLVCGDVRVESRQGWSAGSKAAQRYVPLASRWVQKEED